MLRRLRGRQRLGQRLHGRCHRHHTGSTATKSWTVTWTWGGNQQVTNSWNATTAQSGSAVTAASQTYNGALAPNGTTSFGFQASYSGGNTAPTLTCTAS
ncbi:cellulose binding domain-containing protein [Kitasatospora aureofaciens]|uniref:cellulose binding domain-containing protein n=1 Tax=Kitasatospora aureofaciens TaxID=1894 RepID=UPI001F40A66B